MFYYLIVANRELLMKFSQNGKILMKLKHIVRVSKISLNGQILANFENLTKSCVIFRDSEHFKMLTISEDIIKFSENFRVLERI